MKVLNKHIKTIVLAAGIFLCSTVYVQAAANDGGLDAASDTSITGWAKDNNSSDTPLSVTISIFPEDSSEAAAEKTMMASAYRDSDDYGPYTSGYCGFTWDVDWSTFDNGTYLIKLQTETKKIRKTLSYTNTNGKAVEAENSSPEVSADGLLLGTFKTTGYCPCRSCSEGWGRHTSTGAIARAKHTIAVDPKVIPYGSKILIDGIIYTAEDRGGGVKGNHIDIFFDSHSETRQHGVRYKEAYLLP